jgi:hypothetical protein
MRMNISVPDSLARAVRELDLPISRICQEALQDAAARSVRKVRADLAEKVDNQANWRSMIAEEYPDDPRNHRAENCLRELAGYVRGLPDDDPRLMRAAAMAASIGGDVWMVIGSGEESQYVLGRYGFHKETGPSDGLDWLIETSEQDVRAALDDA